VAGMMMRTRMERCKGAATQGSSKEPSSMLTQTIQRQYDEVISPHYDRDPQSVIGDSLERAADQIQNRKVLGSNSARTRILDVGVGTGRFLAKLKALGGQRVQPFGLDLSEKMVDIARQKVPDLIAAVDDAANLAEHFPDQSFDLICTHFITGFVPMQLLAPKICERLDKGGYWSLVGGTKAGFPALQTKAQAKPLRWLFGGRKLVIDDHVCNPADRTEVVQTLEENGFAVRECETFEPALNFRKFKDFMDFAYWGGWLTPFIEALGLHKANAMTRLMLNLFFFPVHDHHSIEIVLAQKVKT
jgi:SAM-dependent methyltransferase